MKHGIVLAFALVAAAALVGLGGVHASGILQGAGHASAPTSTTGHVGDDGRQNDGPHDGGAHGNVSVDHEFNSTHDGDFANETGEW